MSPQHLIVNKTVKVHAPAQKVWEVLTNPDFIKQWDDIPESYGGGNLKRGSTLDWEGYSTLTVTTLIVNSSLKMQLVLPKVALDPSHYDVSYHYTLVEQADVTTLSVEIGDFMPLPDAQSYYDATLEWVETALSKIQALAEN